MGFMKFFTLIKHFFNIIKERNEYYDYYEETDSNEKEVSKR